MNILYSNGRIRFTTWLLYNERIPDQLKIHNWLTPKGLILPLCGQAPLLKHFLLGHDVYAHNAVYNEQLGVLIQPSGLASTVELVRDNHTESDTTFHAYHLCEDNYWHACRRYVQGQFAAPLMEMQLPLEQVIELMDKCEAQHVHCYQEWDYQELVAWVASEVKTRWP